MILKIFSTLDVQVCNYIIRDYPKNSIVYLTIFLRKKYNLFINIEEKLYLGWKEIDLLY